MYLPCSFEKLHNHSVSQGWVSFIKHVWTVILLPYFCNSSKISCQTLKQSLSFSLKEFFLKQLMQIFLLNWRKPSYCLINGFIWKMAWTIRYPRNKIWRWGEGEGVVMAVENRTSKTKTTTKTKGKKKAWEVEIKHWPRKEKLFSHCKPHLHYSDVFFCILISSYSVFLSIVIS